MTDSYITRQGDTVALTGIISPDLAQQIAVNRSVINPGVTYEIHGTNGHAGWVIATVKDGHVTHEKGA